MPFVTEIYNYFAATPWSYSDTIICNLNPCKIKRRLNDSNKCKRWTVSVRGEVTWRWFRMDRNWVGFYSGYVVSLAASVSCCLLKRFQKSLMFCFCDLCVSNILPTDRQTDRQTDKWNPSAMAKFSGICDCRFVELELFLKLKEIWKKSTGIKRESYYWLFIA
jgi:hypothetical protein